VLEPGDEIDIWVVEKKLGAGGMGSVYRCHNRNATRIKAAVKVLEVAGSRAPGAQERFIREAEILYQLDHPNVVQVRNVRVDHSPPYLEMEYVEGEAIEDKLQRGAIEFETAVDYMAQIAAALAYLHSIGVMHRDIKPANILARKTDNCIKVVDFGLAMESDATRITQSGMTFGTVSYAPPEWVSPDHLDPALWDLYAMGVCFWEMLTGKVAFPVSGQGSARQQAMQVILSKQNHPPLDPGEGYHDDLRKIIGALTMADPKKRPSDAQKVADAMLAVTHTLKRQSGQTLLPPKEDLDSIAATAMAALEEERFERSETDTWILDGKKSDVPAPTRAEQPDTVLRNEDDPITDSGAPIRTSEFNNATGQTVVQGAGMMVGAAAGAGFAVLGVVGLIGVVTFAAIQFSGGGGRPVDVIVSGLPAGTPFDLHLGDAQPNSNDGFIYHFDSVPAGRVQVAWVVGDNCAIAVCPGNECPSWCATSSQTEMVAEGEGVHTLALSIDPPQQRKVRVLTPKVDEKYEVAFTLAGHEGTRVSGQAIEYQLLPGRYDMVATTGTCSDSVKGCVEKADCPKGCASWAGDMIVDWGTGLVEVNIGATNPAKGASDKGTTKPPDKGTTKPPDKGTTKPPDKAKAPVDKTPDKGTTKPPSGGTGAAKNAVTAGQYSKWLATHPDWSKEGATSRGRATGDYLSGWDGNNPPAGASGGAAVNISWYAASAYCKGRGGLADNSAEPHAWTQAHFIEYRQEGGKPAFHGNGDGVASTAVTMKDSNAFTGFRCKR